MSEDISKNTVLVLVVLTVVISLLGTWTVINEATNIHTGNFDQVQPKEGTTNADGRVSIKIERPVDVTGKVTIQIARG